jgi:glycosyltransferase involved in cell wall biosynthesis
MPTVFNDRPGEIVVVTGDLGVGGTERHLVQALPPLRDLGFHPVVYTLTHRGALAPVLEAAGINVVAPPWSEALRSFPGALRKPLIIVLTVVRLAWLLHRRHTQIVHFFLPASYIIGGIVSLVTGPSLRVMSRRSLNDYQRRHRLAAPIEHWLHRRMSAVLGNSCAVVAQLLVEGVPSDRLGLIRNGVDLAVFAGVPTRAAMRDVLGLAPDALVLVLVANLIPYKGHADLIDAFGEIRDALPADWSLLCVGRDDGIGASLRAQAERLGIAPHLRWLGQRNDVPALLGAADIAVLSSHEEGFSNAILECMAAALPVVATDVGGNAEAVSDRETGLLVPPKAPDMLARAILELARSPDLRRQLGAAGRARVERLFSLQSSVDAYAALYAALLDHRPLTFDRGR